MGNRKRKWTSEEEEVLRAGVAKLGAGNWKNILIDLEYAPFLTSRSNVDVKDKWRNMGMTTGAQGSKKKCRPPAVLAITMGSVFDTQNIPSASSFPEEHVLDDPSKSPEDGKSVPRYKAMIFEALSTIKDSRGSDLGAIVSFIKQRQEVPQNFRWVLGTKLRRLVLQGQLEKVGNCYQIKKDAALGTKTPTPKQKDVRPRPLQNSALIISGETVEEAAMAAAYKIAEAEYKSFLAAEAVKEAERFSKMVEDAESMIQLVRENYEQCNMECIGSPGEIVLLA